MASYIGRRKFLATLGGAVAVWPLPARAQQSAMPVVGFLNGLSAGERPHLVESFRRGLSEAGYVAGQEIFFGGTRGGGKTDGVLGKWALKEKR